MIKLHLREDMSEDVQYTASNLPLYFVISRLSGFIGYAADCRWYRLDAYLFYRASRYDVKGKEYLKSLEKYYLVDMGFRNLLPAGQNQDRGYMLENIVYLELARRGYTVHVGKAREREIDFIARRHEDLRYYQVAATALENTVLTRELLPLMAVKDNYPKFLLTLDDLPLDTEGIIHKNIIDFLLE
jgi:predicted AAA+ superfamily ATPase